MRFSTAAVIAFIAYTSSSALAAPISYSEATDNVQYKRDLEARWFSPLQDAVARILRKIKRPPIEERDLQELEARESLYGRHGRKRHSRHHRQSPPPSPVLTEEEITSEEQHIEKRKNVPRVSRNPLKGPYTYYGLHKAVAPKRFNGFFEAQAYFANKLKHPIEERDLQELEARGRHYGRHGRKRHGKHGHRQHRGGRRHHRHHHKHAQPAPEVTADTPAEAPAEAAPERRSLGMEIDELD